jgi:thioredoxin-related protein
MKSFHCVLTPRLGSLALALALALSFGLGEKAHANKPVTTTGVQWQAFDDGLREASKRNKYTFISLYTDWCGYCRKLDKVTFRDKQVIDKLNQDFVSIKFNAESEAQITWKGNRLSHAALADQWGVEGFPTLLFLNSKGEIIGNFASYAEPDLMMKLLGYIASGSREKGLTFDDYLKKDAS